MANSVINTGLTHWHYFLGDDRYQDKDKKSDTESERNTDNGDSGKFSPGEPDDYDAGEFSTD